jgi:hypothetical protein
VSRFENVGDHAVVRVGDQSPLIAFNLGNARRATVMLKLLTFATCPYSGQVYKQFLVDSK